MTASSGTQSDAWVSSWAPAGWLAATNVAASAIIATIIRSVLDIGRPSCSSVSTPPVQTHSTYSNPINLNIASSKATSRPAARATI